MKNKSDIKDYKEALKKFWLWLWHSNSVWSWIVSLIFVFIVVKFMFFPLLSLILATKLPLVVVESSSMHHSGSFFGNLFGLQGSFDSWWPSINSWYEEAGIEKTEAENWQLRTGFEKGDIIVVRGSKNFELGDVIIFEANTKHPVIHRIINISEINGQKVYSTKGDNNAGQLYFEKQIPEEALIGKAVFRIPKLGWVKLIFTEFGKILFG